MSMDKPDPSDVEPVDTSAYQHQRDEDGNLIPEADVVKVGGEWQRVEHLPPTKGFLTRVQQDFEGREEVDMEEIDGLMSDWYVDPDIDDWEDVDPRLYLPLMMHMTETLGGDMDDEVTSDLRDAVEERQSAGN